MRVERAEPFDAHKVDAKPVEWLVDGLFPKGQQCTMQAKGGSGKTFILLYTACCVAYEYPFLGMRVDGGDVVVIDQDTPPATTERRLKRIISYLEGQGAKAKHKIYPYLNKGMSLANGTMTELLQEHRDVALVTIDSLNAISEGLNLNETNDAVKAMGALRVAIDENPDLTVLLTHHISEKKLLSLSDLMYGTELGELFMGNSVIVHKSDVLFIVGSRRVDDKTLDKLYIRPWSRRDTIPQPPFVAQVVDDGNVSPLHLEYGGTIEADLGDDCLRDIRVLMSNQGDEGIKVDGAYTAMGRKHGLKKVYQSLNYLEEQGEVRHEVGKSNQFQYFAVIGGRPKDPLIELPKEEKGSGKWDVMREILGEIGEKGGK